MFKKNKKKHIIFASLILGIISLFLFGTIAYSAINSTMRVVGNAYTRVEADARITDFRLASTNNATSSYEEFGKEHIVTEVDLVDSTSSISYYVEITNYGSTDVGIYSISGLPSGINYSISDYNLKDKICDESGNCNTFIKKTIVITLTTSGTYAGNVQIDFDFRPFLNITYVGFSNQYENCFMAGDNVSVDLSNDNKQFIYAIGQEDFDYIYENNILSFNNVWCDVEVGVVDTADFNYTGDVQSYKVKADGVYKIELWGAGGQPSFDEQSPINPGNGGYTAGNIYLNKDELLYVYVGRSYISEDEGSISYSYNGGGGGEADAGGATDIRLVSGVWNNFDSLRSRIMVAAGGGGGFYHLSVTPTAIGHAGGLIGYDADAIWDGITNSSYPNTGYSGHGATQTSGGAHGVTNSSFDNYNGTGSYYNYKNANGSFGYGGWGSTVGQLVGSSSAGGGGGYYGGGHGIHPGNTWTGGGGGSSFISWHDGCDAIAEASTSSSIVHTNQSLHYSNYGFSDTVMIDGAGYRWTDEVGTTIVGMPNYEGNGTMIGNSGNGYAKISPVAIGDYHLVKFTYNDEDLSDYSYIIDGGDLNITFNSEYYAVVVKNKDGSTYSNYSYDRINKNLIVNDITHDIEIILIRSFNVNALFDAGGDECIHYYFEFSEVSDEHFPITVDFYHKLTTESEYILIQSHEFDEDNLDSGWHFDCDTYAYESYDVKIVFKANNGFLTSIYDTAGTECFVAGTKVLVENGYKNIEDLQVGDNVYALDLETNETVLRPVVRKFEGYTNETFEITVNNKTIIATPKHKFYVVDKGWIRACDLEKDDVLSNLNDDYVITKIKHVKHNELVPVFNLTVDEFHNYFVTEDRVFVHNFGSTAEQ